MRSTKKDREDEEDEENEDDAHISQNRRSANLRTKETVK